MLPRKSKTHAELMFGEQSRVATVKSLLLQKPREDILRNLSWDLNCSAGFLYGFRGSVFHYPASEHTPRKI